MRILDKLRDAGVVTTSAGRLLFGLILGIGTCAAQPNEGFLEQVAKLDIEELMNQQISSAAKKAQPISETAAAVYVIAQEDIRRSGARSFPELLRMVPGINVARIGTHSWAVSARGFNGLFANKLLVLLDGRSIYNPLFGGVYWDEQGTNLPDIDRIEVIRGPGSTLWGANAVNGVINIITKHSSSTQGALLEGGMGSEEKGFGSLRYGGEISEGTTYRAYVRSFDRGDSELEAGGDNYDEWHETRGGMRVDSRLEEGDDLTFIGEVYQGAPQELEILPIAVPPFELPTPDIANYGGYNFLERWTHAFDESSDLQVQAYFESMSRNSVVLDQDRRTSDLDIQFRFSPIEGHELITGAGYRYTDDSYTRGVTGSINPPERGYGLFSAFAQDQMKLIPDLSAILGVKLEHNEFSGFELQPGARLIWNVNPNLTFWSAVTRSVKTPSRAVQGVELDLTAFPNPDGSASVVSIRGNPQRESENLLAYETGARYQAGKYLALDAALFYNHYRHLSSGEALPPELSPGPPPRAQLPNLIQGNLGADSYGMELLTTAYPTSDWQLQFGYSLLELKVFEEEESTDFLGKRAEASTPHNQFSLRSQLNLGQHFELNGLLRWIDSTPALNAEAYTEMDAVLAWKPVKGLEICLVGQNLLNPDHFEYAANFLGFPRAEIERAFYAKFTLQY